jgi:uncharacterized protein
VGWSVIYLDTSVIVPLFLPEPRSREAENLIVLQEIVVSDLAAAEFSSAIAMAVRIGRIQEDAARAVLADFDAWAADHALIADTHGEDFATASLLIRRFDLALRTPDALHIALAARLGARLVTFDAKMAAAASALGLACAP